MKPKRKWKHTAIRQWEGDDGYCWAVFNKGSSVPVISGLTRREVNYYREKIENQREEEDRFFTSLGKGMHKMARGQR